MCLYTKFIFVVCSLILNSSCTDEGYTLSASEKTLTQSHPNKELLRFESGIRSIIQDSRGNYWIGSDREGVCRYDGKEFIYFTEQDGLCGKQIISIQEDETGKVWFGTSNGLCYYDGSGFRSMHGVETSNSPFIPTSSSPSAWVITPTDLWFPGKKAGELVRVDKGKSYTHTYPLTKFKKDYTMDWGITGFSKSKRGGLWTAHYSGVSYFDGMELNLIDDETLGLDGEQEYMHVRSILEDSRGRLWIGNNGIGVQLMENGTISHFSKEKNLIQGVAFKKKSPPGTLMHVFAIAEDSQGNIWFGDRDTGAWRYDGKEVNNFVVDSSLNSYHIWSIYEDKSGNLLFAMGDKGVYKFNSNGFERFF